MIPVIVQLTINIYHHPFNPAGFNRCKMSLDSCFSVLVSPVVGGEGLSTWEAILTVAGRYKCRGRHIPFVVLGSIALVPWANCARPPFCCLEKVQHLRGWGELSAAGVKPIHIGSGATSIAPGKARYT